MSVLFQRFNDLIRRYLLVSACVTVRSCLGAANYYFWDQRHILRAARRASARYGLWA
jgi:hypothetical protein